MLRYLGLAVAQLADPRIRGVVIQVFLYTLLIVAAFIVAVAIVVTQFQLANWEWVDILLKVIAGFAAAAVAALLYVPIASILVFEFLNPVAAAVDARHYPGMPEGREPSFWTATKAGLGMALKALKVNLLILPTSLVPGLYPFIFLVANGYLLGREYFEVVALRRMDPQAARDAYGANRGRITTAGMIVSGLFAIPVVNLLAPVVATAVFVHVEHEIAGRGPPAAS